MNNFNNLLITLFILLFCYILFCWIYKSCVGSKIIEGLDAPRKVTSSTTKKEDEEKNKPESEETKQEKLKNMRHDVKKSSDDRKDSKMKTPPASELVKVKFE
jgi:amino acid permease